MAKKSGKKSKGPTKTSSKTRKASGARAAARKSAGARRATTKAAKRKAPKAKATPRSTGPRRKASRKQASRPSRPAKSAAKSGPRSGKAAKAGKATSAGRARAGKKPSAKTATRAMIAQRSKRRGGTGRESELDQTPETGRSVKGRTNPMPTRRSTGTAAGAGDTRRAPGLERERRRLREVEENVPTPPSSLDMDRRGTSARTGRAEMRQARREHNETSPVLTGGDVDASWEDAYAVGDEAPGGDNPTPDQDRVDDIGKAIGVTYEDNEELKASDKITERDKHRWELDPASSEDYRDRDKDLDEE